MSFQRYRIIFILIFTLTSDGTHNVVMANDVETTNTQHTASNDMENVQSDNKEGRALFPRLEYTNEWTPVGSDPLKDPTFDYMPPVLDRVRYWAEGTSHKNKNDILLLGVPSKKHPNNKKEKYTYGPIKRNFYSMPYQSHYSSPHHHHHQQQQQQQYHSQRVIPPPPQHSHSMMSTHHYNKQQQQYHPAPSHPPQHSTWKNPNMNVQEQRAESSIHHMTIVRPMTSISTRRPSSAHFLPTIPPSSSSSSLSTSANVQEHTSSTPTLPMSFTQNSETTSMAYNSNSQFSSSSSKETTKPLLHTILQTETASPFSFTMKPSSIYQIEYTSNIYNPEAINSMATSSSSSSTTASSSSSSSSPTKPSVRIAMPIKSTTKMTISTSERDEHKHYVQPDMHSAWPVYNLIIEGHSKVKTYGTKNDDPLAHSMPKIRPIQAKDNPIVEHVNDEGPEFKQKNQHQQQRQQQQQKHRKESTMESLLSLLDGSFGNFLQDENKSQYEGSGNAKRKTKRSLRAQEAEENDDDDNDESEENVNNKQERVVGVSFQVDERPQVYRKGTVISENLWPFTRRNADSDISR